jgi:aldose 1-epimerase
MLETLRLEAGPLSAEVIPSVGGGIARFDLACNGGVKELFRAWPTGGSLDPNALGLYILAPWCNRISGGGFWFSGVFHPLAPNLAGEPFPIHGDAWQAPWSVQSRDDRRVRLMHNAQGTGPFKYLAQLDYSLAADGLSAKLAITNQASEALPYGAGFHPWLPRTAGTRLSAPAQSVWLEDERHLPTENVLISSRAEWDFSNTRALPRGWINNGFSGWNGRATILWEDRDIALDISTSPPINAYILYSPSAEASFFCFEPVTHAVNAHNLSAAPETHGLRTLACGATLVAQCQFKVRAGAQLSAPLSSGFA